MESKERKLLFSVTKKDLTITWFQPKGPGGTNKNKSNRACRIKHNDSGVIVECQEHRSAEKNKEEAFLRLTQHPQFKVWHNRRVYEILNKRTIEEEVNAMMRGDKIKTEIRDEDGKWSETKELVEDSDEQD